VSFVLGGEDASLDSVMAGIVIIVNGAESGIGNKAKASLYDGL
jgi:hypothetical protein